MNAAPVSDSERQAIRAAARWYALFCSGAASDEDRRAWEQWYAADPSHRQAWQRVERVRSQMERVPGKIAAPALNAAGLSRRRLVGGLGLLAMAAPLAWFGYREMSWQTWTADLRTATGERRELKLADGSSLTLNTDSAIDVLFSPSQRLLRLRRGEIYISTARDPSATPRPFRVETPQGSVLALGTRFSVRIDGAITHVSVLEKAVEVRPLAAPAEKRVLQAGEHIDIGVLQLGEVRRNDLSPVAWLDGSVIAIDRPLGELLAELSRYRSGLLHCDPRVAGLKISGSFPIDDTDMALAALESAFPLRIVRRTRYWISVEPRG
ncbi:fec operon regulator FecR [compost metagenome]